MKIRTFILLVVALTATPLFAQSENEPAATVVRRPVQRIATDATTANQLPKFADGSGTLTDSIISEVSGKIGIGTDDPKAPFHVFGGATSDVFMGMGPDPSGVGGTAMNLGYAGASFGRAAGFFNVRPDALATAPNPSLRLATANVVRMIITNAGNVGINISEPAAGKRLHVVGDVQFDGTVTGTYIKAHYQDVAEWVPSKSDLAPGTVVVLDTAIGNAVMASVTAYATTVAGVVSAQPGIVLGEEGPSKEQVATSGRVLVKVDASRGAVAAGDLLVTSDTPGYAMRSTPIDVGGALIHRPGTILGKALEPLPAGQGEILVLLSMQ
jgi:hypothetical protein